MTTSQDVAISLAARTPRLARSSNSPKQVAPEPLIRASQQPGKASSAENVPDDRLAMRRRAVPDRSAGRRGHAPWRRCRASRRQPRGCRPAAAMRPERIGRGHRDARIDQHEAASGRRGRGSSTARRRRPCDTCVRNRQAGTSAPSPPASLASNSAIRNDSPHTGTAVAQRRSRIG